MFQKSFHFYKIIGKMKEPKRQKILFIVNLVLEKFVIYQNFMYNLNIRFKKVMGK